MRVRAAIAAITCLVMQVPTEGGAQQVLNEITKFYRTEVTPVDERGIPIPGVRLSVREFGEPPIPIYGYNRALNIVLVRHGGDYLWLSQGVGLFATPLNDTQEACPIGGMAAPPAAQGSKTMRATKCPQTGGSR